MNPDQAVLVVAALLLHFLIRLRQRLRTDASADDLYFSEPIVSPIVPFSCHPFLKFSKYSRGEPHPQLLSHIEESVSICQYSGQLICERKVLIPIYHQ
jgi:hypothetical protein